MANRFVLNETSYHGAGAIAEIATEAVGRGFAKALVCSDPDLIIPVHLQYLGGQLCTVPKISHLSLQF